MTTQNTYDPGPVPPPTEQDRLIARRIRAIAAIHALAQWFTDHPDAPLPWGIEVNADPTLDAAATDQVRLAALHHFAETHHAEKTRHGPHHFAEIRLALPATHGLSITYIVSATEKGS